MAPVSPTSPTPLFMRYSTPRRPGVFVGIVAGICLLFVSLSGQHKNLHLPANLGASLFHSTCNPYDQHGYLAFNPGATHANRWTPFNSDPTNTDTCKQPAPALVAAFLRSSWKGENPTKTPEIGMTWADEAMGPDGREWEDVSWAQNKTVFILGDSISRYTTHYLCNMAGEDLIELNWNHPWSPPEIPKDYRGKVEPNPPVTPSQHDPFGWHKMDPGAKISHTGHYCYVPGLDFLLVHVHTYGLDQEDYWTFKGTYIPPYSYEERINYLAKAYLDRIRATTGRGKSAPELVYVNSGMWDVVKYSHEDTQAELPVDTPLSPERLSEHRSRVRDIVLETANAFPQSKIYWASTHYPIVQTRGWFFSDAKVKPKTRPDMKLIRLMGLHEAAVSAIWDTEDATPAEKRLLQRIHLNRWGLAMRGWEKEQVDDLHPRLLPGGYLWSDMMLYDLRSAVRG